MKEPTQIDGELTPAGMAPEEAPEEETKPTAVEGEKPEEKPEEPPEPTIKELVERLEKSEKRVGYLTRKLSRPGQAPEKPKEPGTKPKEDDFGTYPEYVEALTDWKVDERDAKRTEARIKEHAERQQDEFFAVSVEYFFEQPKSLKENCPAIYKSMAQLLQQDPIRLIK